MQNVARNLVRKCARIVAWNKPSVYGKIVALKLERRYALKGSRN